MAGTIEVVGVYPVDTVEPVHLVEVIVTDPFDEVEWTAFSQPAPVLETSEGDEPVEHEAAAHLAEPVEDLPGGRTRVAFFYHALDLSRPLSSPFGDLVLPTATTRPGRLSAITYGPPL